MRTRSLSLSALALVSLSGCIEESTVSPTPTGIIETGYITCVAPEAGCDGAATCTTAAGQVACVEAPADACAGLNTCACEGAWICGDRACVDQAEGFSCGEPPDPDAGPDDDGGAGLDGGVDDGGPGADGDVRTDRGVIAVDGGADGGAGADGGPTDAGMCSAEGQLCRGVGACCDGLVCNDAGQCARPFTFGVRINNDIESSVYVQPLALDGSHPWLTVRHLDEVVQYQQECGPPDCVDPIVCEAPFDFVVDVTEGGFSGTYELAWDRTLRVPDADEMCVAPEPAPAGEYVATICYGYQVEWDDEAQGLGRIVQPICDDIPFTLPEDDEAFGGFSGG